MLHMNPIIYSIPNNKVCLACDHQHFMLITDYLPNGDCKYKHCQCSEKTCQCPKAILTNLELLEYLDEEKEKEKAALPSVS